jgi:pimeloyl-ACP methyl ester carboxylesterase
MYYEEHGTGTPIIMIHPPAMGRKVFHYQKPLGNQFRLILPDLGGHGDSVTEKTVFTMKDYAAEIAALQDHLGIEKAVVCGYSSGGNVVQEYALEYPERTMAVILCGGYPEVHSYLLKYEHIAGMYMVKRHYKLLAKGIASAHTPDKNVRNMMYQHMLKTNRSTWFHCYHESLHFTCLDRLKELRPPLFLIYGARDFNNKHVRLYQRRVPEAEIIIIKKVAHQVPTKKHIQFNMELTRIISDIPYVTT